MSYAQHSRAAVAYQQTSVQSSSPVEMVVLLYDGALSHLTALRDAFESNDLNARRVAFSRAFAIITELQSTLNMTEGGSIASSLDALYTYMTTRLVDGNVKRDVAAIDEVVRLLRPLRDAWAQIATAPAAAAGSRP